MYLQKEKLQHINSIVHEGKVVLFATDADGIISYTVKQDGFEDSYLNTPAEERTGWESWQTLEFPDEADDKSVIDQEKVEFTHQQDASKFLLKSLYQTKNKTAVAPVQLVSALGHIYVFRQSKSNTLLVDRFVLDGMTNKLKRKLEVRFKRSKQKHTPTKNMNKGSNGLVNIDTLDFRDANGNFFYEPTTEICAVNNLQQGWFSVVLVPTIENDVNRWHIFAYNSQTQKVELTTICASAEGLLDVKDYTFFDEAHGTLIPRKISGIIKRTLDIKGVTVTNGLAATKYDLQEEKETQSGEKQLLKTATQLMLAIPTDKGTAAFSFGIAKDGTLAEIGTTPESTIIRSKQKEILLPLNTLDEIKAFGKSTPPSQGIITGLEDAEDLVKISTDTKAKQLENGDLVKITGNSDYQGFYSTHKVDDNTFEIVLHPQVENLGYWEKEDKEEGRLTFDGRITAYQKTADGKLQIFCENHGLNNGDEVQISGTDSYNDTYPIQKIDDTHFVIVRKWATGEAINVKLFSQKRRGLVFNGVNDYVSLPDIYHDFSQGITVEAWVWYDSFQSWSRIIDFGNGLDSDNIILGNWGTTQSIEFSVFHGNTKQYISASNVLETNQWIHIAATIDSLGQATFYKNGKEIQTGKIHLPKTLKRTKNYIGKSNWASDSYFKGKISDLRTWKVARTADEIKNNMYLQLTGKEVGLVGYWRLGGISEGKVIDFSVNGNDGTVYGDPFVSAVKLNRKLTGGTDAVQYSNPELFAVSERATYEESFEFRVNSDCLLLNTSGLVFDGMDDYVSLPSIKEDFSKGFTVEAWVWYDSFKSSIIDFSDVTLDLWGSVAIIHNSIIFGNYWNTGRLLLKIESKREGKDKESQQITATVELETGKWLHLAATIDGNENAKLYKNGKLIQTGKIFIPNNLQLNENYIGKSNGFTEGSKSDFIQGQISDIRIWQVSRTPEEIQNNMYLELTGKEVGLVGYWPLNSISDGKVIDLAKGNNGIVHGAIVGDPTLERRRSEGKKSNTFTFAYWGKTSQSAEGKKTIPAEYIKQNQFEDLGNGWYRASCNVTIPNGISMLRSFEIEGLDDWESLEIRKHRFRLLSDSITEAKYTDSVSLETLADGQVTLADTLKQLEAQEQKEGELLKEKRELNVKVKGSNNKDQTQEKFNNLNQLVTRLKKEANQLATKYQDEQNSPFNYYCFCSSKGLEESLKMQAVNRDYIGGVWPRTIFFQEAFDNVELTSQSVNDYQKWKFFLEQDGFYSVTVKAMGNSKKLSITGRDNNTLNVEMRSMSNDETKWKFIPAGDGCYYIYLKAGGEGAKVNPTKRDNFHNLELRSNSDESGKWKLVSTGEKTNNNIENAYQAWQDKLQELEQKESELKILEAILNATNTEKQTWQNRFNAVTNQLTTIQTQLSTLNSDFLNGVKNTQANPKTMPEVAKDGKGLVTQGALLGFVQSASRVNAIETCEGKVQLSYFDTQGRMRQTNYDATDDGNNKTFQQWLPDAERACLNVSNNNNVVLLDKPVPLLNNSTPLEAKWTIEAWFFYPLPETAQWSNGLTWNSLTRGKNADHQIHVRNGKELGIYLTNDPRNQHFYDSGFNLELLTQGWHHIAAVGQGKTTLFYINGKKVGDTKAKALADAAANQKEDIEKVILKSTSDVYAIANDVNLKQQFGKVAEVRIWGVALSDDEIAINSKTLLSGNEPGLLAYYPMSEAKGEKVYDKSGNENNGNVSGAMWWGCTAAMGKPGNSDTGNNVMQFDGVDDYVNLGNQEALQFSQDKPSYTIEAWIKPFLSSKERAIVSKWNNGVNGLYMLLLGENNTITICHNVEPYLVNFPPTILSDTYSHVAVTYDGSSIVTLYINGKPAGTGKIGINRDRDTKVLIGACHNKGKVSDNFFQGQIAEVRIWNKTRTQAEIQGDMYKSLSGKEQNLVAYYPLNEIKPKGSTQEVLDLAGNNHGTVNGPITVPATVPLVRDALISSEYSTITLENTRKTAMMRRFFAYCDRNGVTLLPDKRVEALELKWIGNAQFAPTLLGYIEGAPPVPSENLTLSDDYNGATSVELTMSEDVEFSWNRSQESGLGGSGDFSAGLALEASAGLGYEQKVLDTKFGLRGNFEGSQQRQNDTNITASSSLSMTDKLELRGTPEETAKFPHLGQRFIPKNVGYALVVSALADVFVTRLSRSGKMVGYQVQPVDGIPPDVNTITFLINPTYTMNGSLDGMTGSSATTDRFFKHVPEMRSQYGSLYPASYYRLQEAYDLKRQIEAEDKRRESYFANFDVSSVVAMVAMDRNIDKGSAPSGVSFSREEDKPNSHLTDEENQSDEEKRNKGEAKQKQDQEKAGEELEKSSAAVDKKKKEVADQIQDIEKRSQALSGLANWQRRMEDILIRAGKRNIVNTYVWDADGGLRTEAQSFANTIQHSIGSSSSLNLGLGRESDFEVGSVYAGLNSQVTFSLTQTISKTESRSKGIQLNIDLGGLEYKGITDFNDRPILPGEKVDRYRFMSFYLEGSTQNFHDFFSYVVDPEWLQSNSEEARALRQTQAGKPNKAWRVLHRVTYVERPALMGFGRDLRKVGDSDQATAEILDYFTQLEIRHQDLKAENKELNGKIARVQKELLDGNQQLQNKLDQILALIAQKQIP